MNARTALAFIRRHGFVGMHNEALPVAAMRIRNPDRSPLSNQRLRHSPNSNRPG
jgi:hypothetical protein